MKETSRIGTGYDIHRLVEGRRLIIGGVEIPFAHGLLGHSDSDVLTHAICDALLGAAALGDIGTHFPDSDPKWSGVSSLVLLETINGMVAESGFRVVNVDSTVLAEVPKLRPHIEEIRKVLSKALGIGINRVSVKAKTNESLDAVGRREAIAAHAVVIIEDLRNDA